MYLKLLYFLIFNLSKLFLKFKKTSKINNFDFQTYPFHQINLQKYVENGLFKNPSLNQKTLDLKIRGDKNLILSLNSFFWLFILSSINSQASRSDTEYLFKKSNILNFKFNDTAWSPHISGLRLLALSLNINFLKLTHVISNKNQLSEFLLIHVLYLNICKFFISKGLSRLRINMGIFFSTFLIKEQSSNRKKILRFILYDLKFIFENKDKFRNSSDLLEILFFMNRIMKFSSTSDLSNEEIGKKIKKFQNIICPIIKGLRLGNDLLIRSHESPGYSIYCELEKEISDADLVDHSTMNNPNGFIRIKSGRLTFLFDQETSINNRKTKEFMCSAFSFAMTSGNIPLLQNNTSFFYYFGKSDKILFLNNNMNTLGITIPNVVSKNTSFKSKIESVKHFRDLKNNYLETEKVISFNKNLVFYKRNIEISLSGKEVIGKELIKLDKKNEEDFLFYLPFHFHPGIELWKSDKSSNFLLKAKNNEIWRFETDQINASLENYKYLDPLDLEIKIGNRIIFINSSNNKETSFNWKLYY